MLDTHDLGDNGQAGLFLCFGKQLQPLALHALEGIGGGAGLEGAAPEELCPGLLHLLGYIANLLLAFHRARPGNQRQVAIAYSLPSWQGDHRVVRVELPIGLFIRFLHPFDAFHEILGGNILRVDHGGVADEAQHRAVGTHPRVHLDVVSVCQLFNKLVDYFLFLVGL